MVSVSFEVVECRGGLNAKAEYRLVLFSTGDRDGEPKSAYKQGASVVAWDKPFESSTLPITTSQVPIDVRVKPNSWSRHGHNVCSYILNLTHDCKSQTFELDAIKSEITPPPRLSITITVTGLAIAENSIPVVPFTIPSTIATPSPSDPVQDAPERTTASPSIAATEGVNEMLSSARLASEDASHEQARVRTRSFPLAGVVENAPTSDLADVEDAMVSGLSHLDALAQIIDIASDIHPLVKGVWSLFNVAYTLIKQQSELDGKIKTLIEALDANCSFAGALATNQNTAAADSILRSILREVLNGATLVKEYCVVRKSMLSVFKFIGSPIASQVDACLEVLDTFRRELGDHTTASIHHDLQSLASTLSRELESLRMKSDRVEKFVESQENEALLAQMPYAPEADRALRSDERGCLPTTRGEIIEAIINWTIGADSDASQAYIHGLHPDSRVLWLCGVAGSGKSSIAISVARALHSMGRLVALYGFEAAFQTYLNPTNLFSTIARQRAESRPARKRHLLRTLKPMDRHQRASTSPSEQFKLFLTSPDSNDLRAFDDIIVIDAFDESGSVSQRAAALLALSPEAHNPHFPSGARFIITSRYDSDVARRLESVADADHPLCSVVQMEDIHPGHTERDIERYIIQVLGETYGLEASRAAGDLARLAVTAEHSFQWASTACRYIIDSDDHDGARLPGERLEETLETRGGLDKLYLSVLNQSFGASMARESPATRSLRMILGTLVCAFEPVSIQVIAALASASPSVQTVDVAGFHILARKLSSIVTGTQNISSPLVAFHTSFTDFLQDKQRSEHYTVMSPETHLQLASASLAVMKQSLRFNICCLENSFMRNDQLPDLARRVKEHISAELSYACRFWPAHVAAALLPSASADTEALQESFSAFLENKLLVLEWLEVMSLMGTDVLQALNPISFLQADNRQLSDLITFTSYFTIPIATSVPHIYLSALAFTPLSSFITSALAEFPNLVHSSIPLASWPQIRHTFAHQSEVNCVVFSQDGKWLVSGTDSGEISVWDVYSGRLTLPRMSVSSGILSIALSPDGSLSASGLENDTIQLWDMRTMSASGEPLRGHTRQVNSVAFSPNGALLASGSNDGTVRLWNLGSRSAVGEPIGRHNGDVRSVSFSPNGQLLASGGESTVQLWDVWTKSAAREPLSGQEFICSIAFSPDGTQLASGVKDSLFVQDNVVHLWDLQTTPALKGSLVAHTADVRSVAFSPDGRILASCSHDKTVRLWDPRTMSPVGEPLSRHTGEVVSVAFSPDGALLASGSSDKTVHVWDARVLVANGDHPTTQLKLGSFMALSRDGRLLASGSDDDTIQLWDVPSMSPVKEPQTGHYGIIFSAAFSPDGTLLASGSDDNTILLWDARTGTALKEPLRGHSDAIRAISFSPNGCLLASGSDDGTVRLWDVQSRSAVGDPLEGHTDHVLCVAFSPNGELLASCSRDSTVRLWNVRTRTLVGEPLTGHSFRVVWVMFSPDGTTIASGSADNIIRLWNVNTPSMVRELRGHSGSIERVAFSPDGTLLASGADDETIRLWDLRTFTTIGEPLGLHAGLIKFLAFTPDGTQLMSNADEDCIRYWDVTLILQDASPVPPDSKPQHLQRALLPSVDPLPPFSVDSLVRLEDGWVIGPNKELIIWIPPALRSSMSNIYETARVGGSPLVKLDFAHFVCGLDWEKCYDPPSESLPAGDL